MKLTLVDTEGKNRQDAQMNILGFDLGLPSCKKDTLARQKKRLQYREYEQLS